MKNRPWGQGEELEAGRPIIRITHNLDDKAWTVMGVVKKWSDSGVAYKLDME